MHKSSDCLKTQHHFNTLISLSLAFQGRESREIQKCDIIIKQKQHTSLMVSFMALESKKHKKLTVYKICILSMVWSNYIMSFFFFNKTEVRFRLTDCSFKSWESSMWFSHFSCHSQVEAASFNYKWTI